MCFKSGVCSRFAGFLRVTSSIQKRRPIFPLVYTSFTNKHKLSSHNHGRLTPNEAQKAKTPLGDVLEGRTQAATSRKSRKSEPTETKSDLKCNIRGRSLVLVQILTNISLTDWNILLRFFILETHTVSGTSLGAGPPHLYQCLWWYVS